MDPDFVTSTDDELSIHVHPGSATLFFFFYMYIYCSFSVFFILSLEAIPYSHQSCCHVAISIMFLEGKEPEFHHSKCEQNMNLTRGI